MPYLRETRTSLLRAVRTSGTGHAAVSPFSLRGAKLGRAVRTAYRATTGDHDPIVADFGVLRHARTPAQVAFYHGRACSLAAAWSPCCCLQPLS